MCDVSLIKSLSMNYIFWGFFLQAQATVERARHHHPYPQDQEPMQQEEQKRQGNPTQ